MYQYSHIFAISLSFLLFSRALFLSGIFSVCLILKCGEGYGGDEKGLLFGMFNAIVLTKTVLK